MLHATPTPPYASILAPWWGLPGLVAESTSLMSVSPACRSSKRFLSRRRATTRFPVQQLRSSLTATLAPAAMLASRTERPPVAIDAPGTADGLVRTMRCYRARSLHYLLRRLSSLFAFIPHMSSQQSVSTQGRLLSSFLLLFDTFQHRTNKFAQLSWA